MEIIWALQIGALTSLTMFILHSVVLVYMLRQKEKTTATWLLLLFFGCLWLMSISYALAKSFASYHVRVFDGWMDALILCSGVFLMQFAYHYPRHDQVREARGVLLIFVGIAIVAVIVATRHSYLVITTWETHPRLPYWYQFLMPITLLPVILIFFRRAFHFMPVIKGSLGQRIVGYGQGLIRPQNAEVLVHRNFGLATLTSLIQGIGTLLSGPIKLYSVGIGGLIVTGALALVYFNHSPKPITFIVKLVGVSLTTLLIVFGIVGLDRLAIFEQQHRIVIQSWVDQAYGQIMQNEWQEFPSQVSFILTRPAAEQNPTPSTIAYLHPEIAKLPLDSMEQEALIQQTDPDQMQPYMLKPFRSLYNELEAGEVKARFYFGEYPWRSVYQYFTYELVAGDQIYEIGFKISEYYHPIHDQVIRLGEQILFSSLFILFFFPLFFRVNLVSPLQRLLGGIEKANAGERDITISITYEDEIGFLTRAFNNMIETVGEVEGERLRALEMQKAKETAEAANQAKSDFLAKMSHELRTPLNGILGYTQILRREANLSTMQNDGLNIIYNSGHHLLTLINDVLDMAKIEARHLELYPAELELAPFLAGIADIMKMAAHQKKIHLLYGPAPDLPTVILADEKRLRQVLLNLLSNAVKFTEAGAVTFRVTSGEWQGAGGAASTCCLRFEVQDSGVGIAADRLDQIFQPFEQTGDVNYRAEGTGLGLAISRQLVEQMGGQIQVESKLGTGSLFWFEAPFEVVQRTATSTVLSAGVSALQQITGYEGARRRILVVDDRLENRLVLLNFLEPVGFEVALAENGQEAVEQVPQFKPDLIFMDLVMPVMMGFEAVTAIRRMPVFSHTPIIAVTASVLDTDHAASRHVGCDSFLLKPVDADKLFAILQTYLNLTWLYNGGNWERGVVETAASAALIAGVTDHPPIIPPPQEELETFVELARLGNMKQLQEKAARLETTSPQHQPFAQIISQLAADFEDEKLLAFVMQFWQPEK